MTETRAKIRQFLMRRRGAGAPQDAEDLFASGYISSMFAMELVLFVEREFALSVESADLEMANFRSIDAIAAFVDAKRSAPDAPGGVTAEPSGEAGGAQWPPS